jgi:hypothetical protein
VKRWIAAISCLLFVLAGCGGSSGSAKKRPNSKKFNDPAFAITFYYPKSLKFSDNPSIAKIAGGAGSTEARALALDNDNLILVRRLRLSANITGSNVEKIKAELDRAVGSLGAKVTSSKKVKYAGLPGYTYDFALTEPSKEGHRLTSLFDGNVQYNVNCQYTTKRAPILKACREALDSLEHR